MINVQMFNILIKDSAAFKLNTSIKPDRRSWKVKLVLWSAWCTPCQFRDCQAAYSELVKAV